ncbi:hypothetical protein BCV70DRAFT_36170 [Testicularia cyperi]|uniref:Uncharacterized protein n=1 Tax=Testicularia cyperi TaxID=1882483 RepID=A0A317XLJ9_9BASI|nr:hypothetical protein BCV70DRAFT_36170 [Testicularia cyperi]
MRLLSQVRPLRDAPFQSSRQRASLRQGVDIWRNQFDVAPAEIVVGQNERYGSHVLQCRPQMRTTTDFALSRTQWLSSSSLLGCIRSDHKLTKTSSVADICAFGPTTRLTLKRAVDRPVPRSAWCFLQHSFTNMSRSRLECKAPKDLDRGRVRLSIQQCPSVKVLSYLCGSVRVSFHGSKAVAVK